MRAAVRALVAFAAWVAAAPALALPPVHAIVSQDGPAYTAVVAAARAALAGHADVTDGAIDEPVPADAVAVIVVGAAAAARFMASDDQRPVFATLVPSAGWASIAADAGPDSRHTAVWLDQPLTRQLAFLRVLLPSLRELAVVYGPESIALDDALRAAAADQRIVVNAHVSAPDTEINGAVTDLLRRSEALLALPDAAVYNRYNVQSILLASFRARRPVIGFSESWVRAGALASVHATPAQLGTDLGGVVAAWLADRGELPPARASRLWSIGVNRQVAFSLGLNVAPDAVLEQRLRTALGERP